MRPASTVGPTGWRVYSHDVTIPKFPPPPRRPQKRSEFSCSLAKIGRAHVCTPLPPRSPLFPYTTLFRSPNGLEGVLERCHDPEVPSAFPEAPEEVGILVLAG